MFADKQISCRMWISGCLAGEGRGRIQQESFVGDKYVHYLDCSGSCTHVSKLTKMHTLFAVVVCQLYFTKAVKMNINTINF